MGNGYIINEWALVRRNELVDIPDQLDIHPDFLTELDREEFERAFRHIWNMFYQIYDDISKEPERFAMPVYRTAEYRYGSKEAGESRTAAWRPIYLLLFLFGSGEGREGRFIVNCDHFRKINTVRNSFALLKPLADYGFVFEGLKNGKITPQLESFIIDYPDDSKVLTVLELVAKKVLKTQQITGWSHFGNSFLAWNYRILKDDRNTSEVGYEADYVADKMHNAADMESVFEFHRIMKEQGYCYERGGWNEGPDICYYNSETVMKNKGPYLFRMMSWKADLRLFLRIRNAEKCLSYAEDCSEDIKNMFRHSEPGCHNHTNGTCRSGVGYVYDREERWHCGCCSAAFQLHPKAQDIPSYIRLVELGVKK
jgi:hypothetical protein